MDSNVTNRRTENPEKLSTEYLQNLYESISNATGLSKEAVYEFQATIKSFEKTATERDLDEMENLFNVISFSPFDALSLAVMGDEPNSKFVDINDLLMKIITESKSNNDGLGITENVLKITNDQLNKVLTPKQVEHAMKVIRGYRDGAKEVETEAAIQDLLMSAIAAYIKGARLQKYNMTV